MCVTHSAPPGFDISMVFKAILCSKQNTDLHHTGMIIWLCQNACIYALGIQRVNAVCIFEITRYVLSCAWPDLAVIWPRFSFTELEMSTHSWKYACQLWTSFKRDSGQIKILA